MVASLPRFILLHTEGTMWRTLAESGYLIRGSSLVGCAMIPIQDQSRDPQWVDSPPWLNIQYRCNWCRENRGLRGLDCRVWGRWRLRCESQLAADIRSRGWKPLRRGSWMPLFRVKPRRKSVNYEIAPKRVNTRGCDPEPLFGRKRSWIIQAVASKRFRHTGPGMQHMKSSPCMPSGIQPKVEYGRRLKLQWTPVTSILSISQPIYRAIRFILTKNGFIIGFICWGSTYSDHIEISGLRGCRNIKKLQQSLCVVQPISSTVCFTHILVMVNNRMV
jgi:hypothetical protein